MRNSQGYIPRNLGNGTIWDGKIKIRNLAEAAAVGIIIYLLSKLLQLFLPDLVAIGIRIILWAVFCFIAVVGVNGEPLSIFILNVINYSNTRTYVTLQPPQREGAYLGKERKKGKLESLLDSIMTGGPKETKPKQTKAEAKAAKAARKQAKVDAKKRNKQAKTDAKKERKQARIDARQAKKEWKASKPKKEKKKKEKEKTK